MPNIRETRLLGPVGLSAIAEKAASLTLLCISNSLISVLYDLVGFQLDFPMKLKDPMAQELRQGNKEGLQGRLYH